MCGRFALTLPHDAMRQMFSATQANALPDLPNYNICPTNQICAVTSNGGVRHLVSMRWGFIPHWYAKPNGGPLLINARSETIATKPAFRDAARNRRCLIPATGFYEWTKEGEARLPWYIKRVDDGPLVFAGVWQHWEKSGEAFTACAIVTTAAGHTMSKLHHREPVTLDPGDYGKWLGEEGHGAALLMQPAAEGQLEFFRVDPAVNSNRAEGEALIEEWHEA